jgi:hypothetical protein
MKLILMALLALFVVSCAPSQIATSEIPKFATPYVRITFEGTDSLELFTQMTLTMREKSATHGFIFRSYNTGSTSVNALWLKIAGQSAETYFRADNIRENDQKERVSMTLLTDPSPPPLINVFNQSLVVLLDDLSGRLKIPSNKIKIERL